MGNLIAFPDHGERSTDRLTVLMRGGRIIDDDGQMLKFAFDLGSREDWALSAVSCLKGQLEGTQGGAKGGRVEVSASAVGELLSYVEDLSGQLGSMPAPG